MGPETEELEAVEYGDPKSNGAHPAPILTAEELIAIEDVDSRDLFVPKWRRSIRIRQITKRELQVIRNAALTGDPRSGIKANMDVFDRKLLQMGMAEPRLDDAQLNMLMEKSAQAIEFVLAEIRKINGIGEDSKHEIALSFRQ